MNKETAELLSWFISLLFKSSSPAQIFITIHQEDPTALIESKLLPFISAQQGFHTLQSRGWLQQERHQQQEMELLVWQENPGKFSAWKGWLGVQSLEVSKE